jgi:hypothetical protein
MPVSHLAERACSDRRAEHSVTGWSIAGPEATPTTTGPEALSPNAAWSRRVRRVGGLIQAAFGAFWVLRGSLVIGGSAAAVLIVCFGVIVIGLFSYAIMATAGIAPRPKGVEGEHIERGVTLATVIQLVASFALPFAVIAAGHSDWVLPSIAITIGPLLLWLDRRVDIPRYRPVGWALIVGPVILVASMAGTPLIATTGIAAGVLLLGTAAAGFHDLAGARRRAERAKRTDPIVAAAGPPDLTREPPRSATRRRLVAPPAAGCAPHRQSD